MAKMKTWLKEFKVSVEQAAELSADDAQYIACIGNARDEALAIADPLDKYDALHVFGRYRQVDDYDGYLDRKTWRIDTFYSRAWHSRNTWEQQQKKNRIIHSALPIAGTCAMSLLAGAFLPLAWVIAPVVCGAAAFKAIQHRNRINAKNSERCAAIATQILDRAGAKLKDQLDGAIDPVFKAVEDERQRLLNTDPSVKAYATYKPPASPTRNEIKQSIRDEFKKKALVTPESLTVDINPEAKKPSIKLKTGS